MFIKKSARPQLQVYEQSPEQHYLNAFSIKFQLRVAKMLGGDGCMSGLETLHDVTDHGQGMQKPLERAVLENDWGIHF